MARYSTLGHFFSCKRRLFLASVLCTITTNVVVGDVHYQYRGHDGVMLFSDTPVVDGKLQRRSYSAMLRTPTVANPCRSLTSSQLDVKGEKLDGQFQHVAARFGLDPALLKAVARAESCFDPLAVSRAGAKGLMQLMPSTAAEVGVLNIYDQNQNLQGGARYLSAMLQRYSQDTHKALAAYNAGPGNVDRYNGVPPFPETRKYIKKVLEFQKHYVAKRGTRVSKASHP